MTKIKMNATKHCLLVDKVVFQCGIQVNNSDAAVSVLVHVYAAEHVGR